MSDSLIRVEHATKRIKEHTILDDVAFDIRRGEVMGLLGANGAGKTTLLRIMVGLSKPSSGRVLIRGMEYRKASLDVKRLIAFVPDKVNLDPNFTVEQNLILHGELFRLPRGDLQARAQELLAFFDLQGKGDYAIRALSHGMTRKVLIARALISRPEILFLDEPTLGLDPAARRDLIAHIRQLNKKGLTIVISTQSLITAESICHRVAILRKGQLVRLASVRELVTETGDLDEVWLELDPDEGVDVTALSAGLHDLPGVQSIEVDGQRLLVALSREDHALSGLLIRLGQRNAPLRTLSVNRASFEDTFLKLVGMDEAATAT